ncbi:hypothetical protein V1460_15215 [Streptomyces sp. SCSIO 30461]|uniref:hypothetical protein n=1 Tax=Streptomyces sp. SCSIO 30461 TaxID=3118085 RepID=UPI0030CABF97
MARSLDDDASRRISDADEHLGAEQRQAEADEHSSLRELRHSVKQTERVLLILAAHVTQPKKTTTGPTSPQARRAA